VEGATWVGVDEAEQEVQASFTRATEHGDSGHHRH
jgi:hypothetical protein